LGRRTKVTSFCIHGGVDQAPQINKLDKGVDILIATPGRMFDLVSQDVLVLKRVEILVLDEEETRRRQGYGGRRKKKRKTKRK